jgi:glycosyltransferase involved in cell wall biosynthesis
MGVPLTSRDILTDRLDRGELKRSRCDVVFSHRGFPVNSDGYPVIWMHGIIDPEMSMSYFHLGEKDIEALIDARRDLFRRADMVQVCSDAEARRHAKMFPDIANRFVGIPLFCPHITAAPESILNKHDRPAVIQILFVGNDARRKGLQETLDAFMSLSAATRHHATFTIVSHFDDGDIKVPNNPQIKVHKGMAQQGVTELMRRSHVLANVSRHESFGNVYLEAMSQGALCIGPNWEVQRELFDNGRAGMNVNCQVDSIRAALLQAIEDEELRASMARAGWRRFQTHYAPEIVAGMYARLFRSVKKG